MENTNLGVGDYIFTTEMAHTHKLQIGKIIAEYYGSDSNTSYYSIMFGDGNIEEFPMVNIDNNVKLLRKKDN